MSSLTTAATPSVTPTATGSNGNTERMIDIEQLHEQACSRGQMSYIDPATGFTCFTRIAHLQRGICCGNYCRHCPYDWKNAKKSSIHPLTVDNDDDDDDSSSSNSSSCCNTSVVASNELQDNHPHEESLPLQMMNDLSLPRGSAVESAPNLQSSKTGGKYGGTLTKKNVVYTRGGDTGTSQLLNGERRLKSDMVFEALGTVDELCSIVGVCYAELTVAIQSMHPTTNTNTNTNTNTEPINHMKKRIELETLQEWLLEIMSRLFDIGSHVAKPRKETNNNNNNFVPDGVGNGFDATHIQELEMWIDTMTEALPELTSFVLPTGSRTSAQLHVARTVCRRTERTIVPLVVVLPAAVAPSLHPSTGTSTTNNASMNTITGTTSTNTNTSGCDPNALAYINRLSDFFFTAARYVNDRLNIADIAYQRPTRGAKQRTRVVLEQSKDVN